MASNQQAMYQVEVAGEQRGILRLLGLKLERELSAGDYTSVSLRAAAARVASCLAFTLS